MATTNQRNRSGGPKGSAQGKVQKTASQVTDKVADMRDEMAGYVSRGTEQFGELTRGHEGQAVLIALAAGFGIGFVIGCSLASGHREPESWRDRIMAEGIGRKFLHRVESMMPQAVGEYLGR
jgi:hypothetical protein